MEGRETSAPIKQPPYGSVKWYEDFFKLLERIQIGKVDISFLKTNDIAVGNEYKVITGLEFLDLIDENGNAKKRMSDLKVFGDEYTKNFEKMVRDAYSLLMSKVELEKALPNDVVNSFISDYNMARSTAQQGAKIFVFLAQKAGIPISEPLADMRAPEIEAARKRGRGKKKIEEKVEEKKGMHKIEWGDSIIMYLRKGDRSTRERIAKKAKQIIDMYVEED